MQTVIIVIHLMVVVSMIGLVLLQRSEGGGLGMGGGGGFMSNRGTANVLTRATGILAMVFFVTSLSLSWLANLDRKPATVINSPGSPSAPAGPSAPISQGGGGVLNQLNNMGAPAPTEPQVPRSQ